MKIKLILCLLFAVNSVAQTTIYTIGDSTMANKPNPEINPERGWAQMLPQFFKDNVEVNNHAVNGRSTRSFIDLNHWGVVYGLLKEGDYVFIQFGHNDGKKTDSTRYTNPHTAYRYNLIKFITETREKGAIPILFSSIARRKFNTQGVLLDSHGNYPLVVRLVAQEYDIDFIDLQYLTEQLEESYGVEGSKKLHLHFTSEENSYYPDGINDNTHLSILGATEIAKLVIKQIKEQAIPLTEKIK